MVGCPADPQCQCFLENLIIPERFVVRVEQDMSVGVDQPRQQGRPRQFDRPGSPRGPSPGGRSGRLDDLALDHDDPAVVSLECQSIPNPRSA